MQCQGAPPVLPPHHLPRHQDPERGQGPAHSLPGHSHSRTQAQGLELGQGWWQTPTARPLGLKHLGRVRQRDSRLSAHQSPEQVRGPGSPWELCQGLLNLLDLVQLGGWHLLRDRVQWLGGLLLPVILVQGWGLDLV